MTAALPCTGVVNWWDTSWTFVQEGWCMPAPCMLQESSHKSLGTNFVAPKNMFPVAATAVNGRAQWVFSPGCATPAEWGGPLQKGADLSCTEPGGSPVSGVVQMTTFSRELPYVWGRCEPTSQAAPQESWPSCLLPVPPPAQSIRAGVFPACLQAHWNALGSCSWCSSYEGKAFLSSPTIMPAWIGIARLSLQEACDCFMCSGLSYPLGITEIKSICCLLGPKVTS